MLQAVNHQAGSLIPQRRASPRYQLALGATCPAHQASVAEAGLVHL